MNLIDYLFLKTYRTTDWEHLQSLDYFLPPFNSLEACVWFICAAFVLRRNLMNRRCMLEYTYAGLFVLFGLTDVFELFGMSAPLIWLKLAVLVPLFWVRSVVLYRYEGQYKLV